MTNVSSTTQTWPELTLSAWEDTRDTFHMWTQIVGKIRLALEPMLNHWWQVSLYVSARAKGASAAQIIFADSEGLSPTASAAPAKRPDSVTITKGERTICLS